MYVDGFLSSGQSVQEVVALASKDEIYTVCKDTMQVMKGESRINIVLVNVPLRLEDVTCRTASQNGQSANGLRYITMYYISRFQHSNVKNLFLSI